MSSEQSKVIYLEIGDILMRVKEVIFTQLSRDLSGQTLPGGVTYVQIVSWLNNHSIDITIDASCAKRLATELTTEVNLEHSLIKLRLISL